jgi:hypothetical protein
MLLMRTMRRFGLAAALAAPSFGALRVNGSTTVNARGGRGGAGAARRTHPRCRDVAEFLSGEAP